MFSYTLRLKHNIQGEYSPLRFGSVVSILSPSVIPGCERLGKPYVVVRMSTIQRELHAELKMPVLTRDGQFCLYSPEVIFLSTAYMTLVSVT